MCLVFFLKIKTTLFMRLLITLQFTLLISVSVYSQNIRFSYGFDLLYFPQITPKFEQYSESYKLAVSIKIMPKINLVASYRYAGITGNYPHVLDDYPNISNTDPNQEKYIDYDEFKPGLHAVGQEGLHWSQFINLVGLDLETKLLNVNDRFWIDFLIGGKLEFLKVNSVRLVIGDITNGAILTEPDGDEVIVQFHTYDVTTSVSYVVNSTLQLNQKLSKNTHVFLGTDFNYLLSGDAYWYLDLGIGYKF